MSSPSSSDRIHRPQIESPGSLPWSPTSATQVLSNPGSFPASESEDSNSQPTSPPVMVPGYAFEIQTFNIGPAVTSHSKPVLTSTDFWQSPMDKLFSRIVKNDRNFVQQLPSSAAEQKKQGIFLDHPDAASGRTPLTAALVRGYLDLAVDLLMQGAGPAVVDSIGRTPEAAAGADTMAVMVLRFMRLRERHGTPRSTASAADKDYQKLLTKIDPDTGQTLLTWAISQRHHTLVTQLVRSGADCRVSNRFGRTAIEEACQSGSLVTVSLLLKVWPTLASVLNREYLMAAILAAARANRPMVLAQLLSFFRDEFRLRQDDDMETDDDSASDPVSSDPVLSDPSTQLDVYRSFLGAKPEPYATLETMMQRTYDNYLLTEKESRLLKLSKVVAFATENGLTKIVEIIHAHARLPNDG